jgi:hypothetical protein
MQEAVKVLIPVVEGEANAKIAKAWAWNQGGYDFVRIVKTIETKGKPVLHLRFSQVTKSSSHSLKLHFFLNLRSIWLPRTMS